MFNWHIKEKPLFGLFGMGGGVGTNLRGASAQGWDSFSNTSTFTHTGSDQSFPVPASTTQIGFMIWGAAGGSTNFGNDRTAAAYTIVSPINNPVTECDDLPSLNEVVDTKDIDEIVSEVSMEDTLSVSSILLA